MIRQKLQINKIKESHLFMGKMCDNYWLVLNVDHICFDVIMTMFY